MIKNNKVNLIKSLIDIDDKFKIRMLNFFKNNFKDNLFYNENYYFDILKFCDNNKIRFSLSEFLAINFYYFSKSQNLNSSYYLTEYLKLEEKSYGNKILSSYVNRAKKLIVLLFNQEENNKLVIPKEYENSINKINDILNLYFVYDSQTFEITLKNKIQDDYERLNHIVDLDELYLTNIDYLKNVTQIFKTDKFLKVLENTAISNIKTMVHYNTKELEMYSNYKKQCLN